MEAPGGEEMEVVKPDDEAMCCKKVTRRPQCDRLESEDMTQVVVDGREREAHGRRWQVGVRKWE